jgi:hypothetical protein
MTENQVKVGGRLTCSVCGSQAIVTASPGAPQPECCGTPLRPQ